LHRVPLGIYQTKEGRISAALPHQSANALTCRH